MSKNILVFSKDVKEGDYIYIPNIKESHIVDEIKNGIVYCRSHDGITQC